MFYRLTFLFGSSFIYYNNMYKTPSILALEICILILLSSWGHQLPARIPMQSVIRFVSNILTTHLPAFTGMAALLGIYLLIMFVLVIGKKDFSFGNFTWGGGVVLLTLYTFLFVSSYSARQILLTLLVTLWGIRLSVFFYSRYKKGADPRYVSWAQNWGAWSIVLSFLWVVILNSIQTMVMSLPSLIVNTTINKPLTLLDLLGTLIWIIGFYFESVGDYQLYTFTRNPDNKGKIMDHGLWKYSRHPNYFGEIAMWWGVFLIALSAPYGYLALIAPLVITALLVFFTGIPWNEAVFKDNPDYQEYKKRTSMLIPWWPKKQ